jgi:hypothetical protein
MFLIPAAMALTVLRFGVPEDVVASSKLFVGLRDSVSFDEIESLVLFLRVCAYAADGCEEMQYDGQFLINVFATHYADERVPLLVLPLIHRCLTGGSLSEFVHPGFVDCLFWVLGEGHFRARIRTLVVIGGVIELSDGDFLVGILERCDGEMLTALLDSGNQSWVIAILQFINLVVRKVRDRPEARLIIGPWMKSGLVDCLTEIIGVDPAVELVLEHLHTLANLVL